MQVSINKCILLGTIDKRGVEVSYHGQGSTRAKVARVLTEQGSDGKEHQAWHPCEVWGRQAEQIGELEPGDAVLLEGKLKCVKQGETWITVVSGFDAQPLRWYMRDTTRVPGAGLHSAYAGPPSGTRDICGP